MILPTQSLPDAPPVDTDLDREVSPRRALVILVAVGALVATVCVLGATWTGLFGLFTTASGAAPEPVASTAAVPAGQRVPGTTFADGQWLVGGDIVPGTYSATVPDGSSRCAWERNASTDRTANSVLESGNGQPGETIVVNVKDTDKIFQSTGCGTWQRTAD